MTCIETGKVWAGAREVTAVVTELLGLDERQFRQTMMIARGDFLRILHARSDERECIFEEIFGTQLYARIADEVTVRWKAVREERQALLNGYEQLFGAMQLDDGESEDAAVLSFQFAPDRASEAAEALGRRCENDDAQLMTLDGELERVATARSQAQERLNTGRMVNDGLERLATAEAVLAAEKERATRSGWKICGPTRRSCADAGRAGSAWRWTMRRRRRRRATRAPTSCRRNASGWPPTLRSIGTRCGG